MPCATVDRRRTARRFIPIDSQLPPPPPRMASGSTILLEDARLWSQFHSVGNEMIITKNGRCLFPTLRFRPIKLDPKALYSIAVDIVQAVPHKFKFNKSGIWMPVPHDSHGMGEADDDELLPKCTPFVHPGAPQTGTLMFTRILFTSPIEHNLIFPFLIRSLLANPRRLLPKTQTHQPLQSSLLLAIHLLSTLASRRPFLPPLLPPIPAPRPSHQAHSPRAKSHYISIRRNKIYCRDTLSECEGEQFEKVLQSSC